ncbi:MAG TPA: class I SAM-dependent methyltransferase [candidate division Zixibacteria bacterium]|nr:class I SAM-dependent methyltransferase [candidate division Zixibacteria bacterium]
MFESGWWDIPRGPALDVATGEGRNALFLASLGFEVVGVDVSPVALAEARRRALGAGLSVDWRQADLESEPLPKNRYRLVVDFNYLQRSLTVPLKNSLVPGGFVVFETYLIDQREIGHPRNPAYLLQRNELLSMFRDFRVLLYREGKFFDGGRPAFRAGIFAQKPG